MRLVLTRVSQDLRRDTAGAPNGAAQVFAGAALGRFRNLVTRPRRLADPAERVNGPDGKAKVSNKGHGRNPGRHVGGVFVTILGVLERGRVDDKARNENANDAKGAFGLQPRTGFAQPGQVHAGNRLSHGELVAKQRAAERRVAKARLEHVKGAVLPFARGGTQTSAVVARGKRSHKYHAFTDAAFGDGAVKDLVGVVVNVGFKGVALRQGRRSRHVDHHGDILTVGVQRGTARSFCRRHGWRMLLLLLWRGLRLLLVLKSRRGLRMAFPCSVGADDRWGALAAAARRAWWSRRGKIGTNEEGGAARLA